jgi:hypothetical protein
MSREHQEMLCMLSQNATGMKFLFKEKDTYLLRTIHLHPTTGEPKLLTFPLTEEELRILADYLNRDKVKN